MNQNKQTVFNQSGAVAIIVAVCLVVLLGFTALSVDIGRWTVFQNRMQNAVDAGALAGGRVLFNDSDGALNISAAEAIARSATEDNSPSGGPFDLLTVEIGNWTFATRTFTVVSDPTAIDFSNLIGLSEAEVDLRTDFVNAIRVTARTEGVSNFFGGFLGYADFDVQKDAVAWRGFAGGLGPGEADQPIAVCFDSITDPSTGGYRCNVGRFTNSGSNLATNDTIRWSSLAEEEGECASNTPASTIRRMVDCNGSVNQNPVSAGMDLPTNNGELESALSVVRGCFFQDPAMPRVLSWKLPVIDCGEGPTCGTMVGAVSVEVVWITESGNDPGFNQAPTVLYPEGEGDTPLWEYADNGTNGEARWADFVDHFNLEDVAGGATESSELYNNMSIYFLTSCEEEPPSGPSGGPPFNVPARYPKLVE